MSVGGSPRAGPIERPGGWRRTVAIDTGRGTMDLFDDLSARAAPVAPGRARTAEGSDELAGGVVGVARAPLPAEEEERLRELDRYGVLDTEPEDTFDDLTRLAAYVCEAPIALISLVDAGRQWFKSRYGLSATETSRDISFCSHAILEPDLFVVPDALADPRFAANPLVTS